MTNKTTNGVIITLTIICIIFHSCETNNSSVEAGKIVKEWTGKKIIFPQKITCISMNKDTSCILPSSKSYKILVYTDAIGCISCKLDLAEIINRMTTYYQ